MKSKLAIIGIRGYPANFPGSSGIDTYIEKLIPHLQKKYKLNLYTRSWAHSITPRPKLIKIISIPTIKHYLWDTTIYTFLAPIIALIQKNDIFWFHAPSSCLLMPLVRLCGKKIIFTSHGIDWQRDKWHFPLFKYSLKFLEFICIKNSHFQTAVSPDIVNYLNVTYSIKTIYLPVGAIKTKSPSSYPVHILYLGRLVPEKRIDWIIKAHQKLPKNLQKKYPLIIAGEIDNNQTYTQKLHHLTNSSPYITFVGYIGGSQKEIIIKNSKLLVLPSNLEGNSLTLNEAIGYNLVCLAANLPIHQQIHTQYPNLYLFDTNSFTDFFQKFKISLGKHPLPSPQSPYPTWTEVANIFTKILNNQ